MPGLLDELLSPEVRGLLRGTSAQSDGAGMGLLTPQARRWAGPKPDEGFMTRLFGDPNDPADPRGSGMMAFAAGLARRDIPGALWDHARFMQQRAEMDERRQLTQMGLVKGGIELQKLLDDRQRQQRIRSGIAAFEDQQQRGRVQASAAPHLDINPSDEFGTAAIGELPMFGMGGAERFGTQPIGSYSPPAPRTSMPQPTSAAPVPFNVGRAGPAGAGGAPDGAWNALGTQPNASREWINRLRNMASLYAREGDMGTAVKLLEEAGKMGPEFATEFRQVTHPRTGEVINVMVGKDGTVVPVPFGVKPDISMQDLGDRVQAIDRNAVSGGQSWRKGYTPSDRIAAGNLELARRRFDLDQSAPQYVQTEDGYIALPKRPGPGPIVGTPVVGPDGQAISRPLKPIPASANTAIATNQANLARVREAISLVGGSPELGIPASPNADPNATGWKGFVPNTILNRIDEAGVDARGAIADLGSMVIHDRSGAAVTAAEFPRLAPFIPQATDDPTTVKKKLERFWQVYRQEAEVLGSIYSKEQGYRPNPALQRNPDQRQQEGGGQAFDKMPRANPSNKGKILRDTATGKRYRSNGLSWEEVQ